MMMYLFFGSHVLLLLLLLLPILPTTATAAGTIRGGLRPTTAIAETALASGGNTDTGSGTKTTTATTTELHNYVSSPSSSSSAVITTATATKARNGRLLLKEQHGDRLQDFRTNNLLRDDFARPAQRVVVSKGDGVVFGSQSSGSSRSSSGSTASTFISLNANDLVPMPSVFSTTSPSYYYANGVLQAELPDATTSNNATSNGLFLSRTDPDVTVVLHPQTGEFLKAIRHDPVSKLTTALLPLDLELGVFAEVGPEDVDQEKLNRFHYDEQDDDDDRRRHRQLLSLLAKTNETISATTKVKSTTPRSMKQDEPQQQLQQQQQPASCQSYKTLEVAIVYESRFCQFFGGTPAAANQVVYLTVAAASRKFQQPGICTKVVLTHLEGHCDPTTDPYRDMFSGSVCKREDDKNIMKQFKDYWVQNRSNVQRDVAHLFHGFPHSSGTVGCAYASSLCDNEFSYGVNEITYGGNNNPNFWSTLFAHELGHSAGAFHECCDGYIMDVTMCTACQEFSPSSVAHMQFYMDSDEAHCLLRENNAGSGGGGGTGVTTVAPPLVLSNPVHLSTPSDNNGGGGRTNNRPIASSPAPAPAPAKAPSNTNTGVRTSPQQVANGKCLQHMEYCSDTGTCCEGVTCHNGFICLDLD